MIVVAVLDRKKPGELDVGVVLLPMGLVLSRNRWFGSVGFGLILGYNMAGKYPNMLSTLVPRGKWLR